jgi:alkanesulfonate monooxygenase SsuD/methylene tetrahydromethanopterin reductase-like flavin-dependent oxidoreductase (luciferase family)
VDVAQPVKVGLMLPTWTAGTGAARWSAWSDPAMVRWPNLAATARIAEDAGFDSIWVPDHLLIDGSYAAPDGVSMLAAETEADPASGVWESWSMLAGLAAVTSRIRFGTLVTCTGFRSPAHLARIADTVDEISGGRVILGLGAGDHGREHDAFGFVWPRRIDRFEEALQIIVPLLRDGRVDFAGEFYSARDCEIRPRGRHGGPPILVGALGTGPRMLGLVARYADMWNGWFGFKGDERARIEPIRRLVDAACVEQDRDPATLERTVGISVAMPGTHAVDGTLTGSPSEIAAGLATYAAFGVDLVQVVMASPTPARVEAFGAVIEELTRVS